EFVPPESGRIHVAIAEDNNSIEVRVMDNGPGIAEEIRRSLFRPFVSHGKQHGIGLGLAISKKILADHGGDLYLESSLPGRTVFKLVIPAVLENVKLMEVFGVSTDSEFDGASHNQFRPGVRSG